MMEILQSILALIVTLSILVTIHEFGHYWVARMFNVHVLRFSVGFGKPIYMKRGPAPGSVPVPADQEVRTRGNEPLQGTEFAVAAIPLGGYVKMLDEREGFVPDDQLHLAFNRKPVGQRIAIVAAGPIANFLLAIVAYWVLFTVGVAGVVPLLGNIDPESKAGRAGFKPGQEIVAIDGTEVKTWSDVNLMLFKRIGESGNIVIKVKEAGSYDSTTDLYIVIDDWMSEVEEPYPVSDLGLVLKYPEIPARIGGIVADGRAEQAGLLAGDEVLMANGEQVPSWISWVEIIRANPEVPVSLEVLRDSEVVRLMVKPERTERNGEVFGFIGASREAIQLPAEMQRNVTHPVYYAWIPAVKKTWEVTVFTLVSIKKMILGAISPKNLSGPITIAQVAHATAQSGLASFVGFIALLSISLGVLNLLPIPVLDGGHLLYYFIELVVGKPVPERIQVWGLQMGMFLIFSIMLLAFYNDLTRL
jgi:regulator of sigma E protease|tara:strand:- start:4964 stop:6385 length:1422 start_codon:yes stop_codon:yes gene_type:complete